MFEPIQNQIYSIDRTFFFQIFPNLTHPNMNPEGPIGDAFQALDPPSFVTICQIIVSNTEAHYCLQIEHVSEVKGVLSLYASGGSVGARYAKREDSVC